MVKARHCRYHALFVFMLALASLSLLSHLILDVSSPAPGSQSAGRVQQTSKQWQVTATVHHSLSLHGDFIVDDYPVAKQPAERFSMGKTNVPFEQGWEPPTLVLPPIAS